MKLPATFPEAPVPAYYYVLCWTVLTRDSSRQRKKLATPGTPKKKRLRLRLRLRRRGEFLPVKQKVDETKPGPASVPFRSDDAGADRVNTLRKARSTHRVTDTSVSPAWFRPPEALLRLRGDAVQLAAAADLISAPLARLRL